MKKMFLILFIILVPLIISCENNNDTVYMGVNAEILEISSIVKGIVVKGSDNNSMLGDECYINCESPETYFIYVEYSTGELSHIEFDDLIVGDKITVDIKSVENKYALTSRIQLLTQRR